MCAAVTCTIGPLADGVVADAGEGVEQFVTPACTAVQWPYSTVGRQGMATTSRRRSCRLELRTTPEERSLIDRATAATGTDLTEFIVTHATDAARRVLADRDRFTLDEIALAEWEAINARPARDLPGLRRLLQRPSPFTE